MKSVQIQGKRRVKSNKTRDLLSSSARITKMRYPFFPYQRAASQRLPITGGAFRITEGLSSLKTLTTSSVRGGDRKQFVYWIGGGIAGMSLSDLLEKVPIS